LRGTLRAAADCGFDLSRLIFEVTESEKIVDAETLVRIFREYRKLGIKTAIDDFGAGYSGLNLLAEFQPDIIKLDMALVRNIDTDHVRQAIVKGIVQICKTLHIQVVAEGVETVGQRDFLGSLGCDVLQGYLYGRPVPAFEMAELLAKGRVVL